MSVRVLHGDCMAILPTLDAESVHAVVTDPPAGISFMGRAWDSDKGGRERWIAWMQEIAAECLRVAKPGAHALVWALPRTSHWTATAWENAGWSVRDRVSHLFGSGFPKSHDVSAAIDRAAGAEREIIGPGTRHNSKRCAVAHGDTKRLAGGVPPITAPATPEAARWQGWGTALKPACEDWWLLRKPLAESTIAANVLAHGCGAINVDACRIGLPDGDALHDGVQHDGAALDTGNTEGSWGFRRVDRAPGLGRWPANLVWSKGETEYQLRPNVTANQKRELYRWLSENA